MASGKMTLKQVAERAGVSITAASMYLNGKAKQYNLADATCARIEKVIRECHYVPNIHARAIASKKTYLAGVIIDDDLDYSFWLNIISAIETTLASGGYHMLLSVTRADAAQQEDAIRFMLATGIDGLMIKPVFGTEDSIRELAEKLPLVVLNSHIPGLSSVWNDDYAGGRAAVRALTDAGHTKIAYLEPIPGLCRTQAYSDAMLELGGKPVFFDSAADFLKQRSGFTAVLCSSDYVLLDLYQQAQRCGLKIPEELSCVGYDRMDFTALMSPAPVTVDQYKKEIGYAAAEILLSQLSRKNAAIQERRFEPPVTQGASIQKINS